jgi:hypothetical protein
MQRQYPIGTGLGTHPILLHSWMAEYVGQFGLSPCQSEEKGQRAHYEQEKGYLLHEVIPVYTCYTYQFVSMRKIVKGLEVAATAAAAI